MKNTELTNAFIIDDEYISFDFDDTLYDPKTNDYNWKIYDIFKQYIREGEKVCITTLRNQNDCEIIKEMFPNIPIYPCNLYDKSVLLKYHFPVKVKMHYDDDITCCMRLQNSSIKPIWVRSKRWDARFNKLAQIKSDED